MALLLPTAVVAREATVTSPNGKLVVTINDEGQQATYAVTLDGHQMLLPSALGFKANFGDFTQKLTITGTKTAHADRTYEMRQVKQSKMHYVAEQLTVDFENAKGQKMSAEFSVSNNDVAFRYLIPRQKNDNPKCAVIEKESTAFRLPDGTTTFITPHGGMGTHQAQLRRRLQHRRCHDGPLAVWPRLYLPLSVPCPPGLATHL